MMPKDIIKKFQKQYGKKKGKQIYYATAKKQGRDPETFEKEDIDRHVVSKNVEVELDGKKYMLEEGDKIRIMAEEGGSRDDEIRSILKELESGASDSLGDLGSHMIENAIDEISERLDLSEEEAFDLMNRIGVGITFELE
ncbi:MAG: hypothetical protein GF411_18875 [Candidatus Lokiarchaeota archaeon]|nr:hypothetical protein [Candidatus Lokiarchaeota archaeon]